MIIGVTLDSLPNFKMHVNDIVKAYNYHLHAFRLHLLTVIARLRKHYRQWNDWSHLNQNTTELQLLENNLKRSIRDIGRRDRNDHKHDMHWLPIRGSTG